MALKLFLLILILLPALFIEKDDDEALKMEINKELPKIIFLNAMMQDINEKSIDKIVNAKEVRKYEYKDEIYDGELIWRNTNNNFDTIKAGYVKKERDMYLFQKHVFLKRGLDLELSTNEILYNQITDILSNNDDFVMKYKNSVFTGRNLYMNRNDQVISGDNAHFKINKKDF
jgi:hypothetical protein